MTFDITRWVVCWVCPGWDDPAAVAEAKEHAHDGSSSVHRATTLSGLSHHSLSQLRNVLVSWRSVCQIRIKFESQFRSISPTQVMASAMQGETPATDKKIAKYFTAALALLISIPYPVTTTSILSISPENQLRRFNIPYHDEGSTKWDSIRQSRCHESRQES